MLVETHQEVKESSKGAYYGPLMTQIWHSDVPPRYEDIKRNGDGYPSRQSLERDQSKTVDPEERKHQSSTNSPRNQLPWRDDQHSMSDLSRRGLREDRGDPSLTEFKTSSNIWPEVSNSKKLFSSVTRVVDRSDGEISIAQELTVEEATSADPRSPNIHMQLQSNLSGIQRNNQHKCDQDKDSPISGTDSGHDASKKTSAAKSAISINYSVSGNHKH